MTARGDGLSRGVVLLSAAILFGATGTSRAADVDLDPATGLPIAPGFDAVRLHCGGCHSTRLVAQNRATREGWRELIRWMQRTQRLGSLGDDEDVILDYLATHRGPARNGARRRAPLPPALRPPPE